MNAIEDYNGLRDTDFVVVVLHTLCYNLAIDNVYSIYVSFLFASFN